MFHQLVEAIRDEVLESDRGAIDKWARRERQASRGGRGSGWSVVKRGAKRARRRAEREGERQAAQTGDTPNIPPRPTSGYAT